MREARDLVGLLAILAWSFASIMLRICSWMSWDSGVLPGVGRESDMRGGTAEIGGVSRERSIRRCPGI